MQEFFQAYNPRGKNMKVVRQARSIIEDYQARGYLMTLRQLYYQFVARDLLPNTEASYNRLGNIISRARLGGLIDWDALTDRVRQPVVWEEWSSVEDMLRQELNRFRFKRLEGQANYVELWVEKDALASVLQPIAMQYHVTLMVNRGYSSSSAMKEAADRIRRNAKQYGSRSAIILYLGDLDPSGEDMVRDISERLDLFCNSGRQVLIQDDKWNLEPQRSADRRKPFLPITVEKLALTIEQVRQYNPPPNPTKLTDTRAKGFIEKYGNSSWEVDALDPSTMRTLIEDALEEHLDMGLVEKVREHESEVRARIIEAVDQIDLS